MHPIAMANGTTGNGVSKEQGTTMHAPPIVTGEEFHKRAAERVHDCASDSFAAFYSSWTDCITRDASAMVLPMDDHMAHRGHGVFDTAHLHAGKLHMLDRHVERFFKSMRSANIDPPFDFETTKSLILRVAAAGGLREGQLRFYASAGPGGFALDQSECVKSVFYCISVRKRVPNTESEKPEGVSVVTSKIPIKPPYFATVKSTNYLPNALVVADAKKRGVGYGIWLTEDGLHVAEGSSMNVGFVVRKEWDENDEKNSKNITEYIFKTPPWDETLAGCTIARVVEFVNEGRFAENGLKGPAVVDKVTVETAKNATEAMLIGSVINCVPIVTWDGEKVGDNVNGAGAVGPIAVAIRDAIVTDFEINQKELTNITYDLFE